MNPWVIGIVAMLAGIIPGVTFVIWWASPFAPGAWKLAEPVARLLFTLSQYIRGKGILVKLKDDTYRIGTYVEEEDGGPAVAVDGRQIDLDGEEITWRLLGRKPFGVTWEPGTMLHQIIEGGEAATDGGGYPVDLGAFHRHLEGTNSSEAIDRTQEHAKAEFGGGSTKLGDWTMVALIVFMMILGTLTSYLMVG
jgi:hypothetical protein